MKFRQALNMWLLLFLMPRLKLLREPIFENLWPRRAIKTFCEPFVSEFDVGQGGQPVLQGWFEIVRIESRGGWPGGLNQRLGHDLIVVVRAAHCPPRRGEALALCTHTRRKARRSAGPPQSKFE